MDQKTRDALAKLTETVERGFAESEDRFARIEKTMERGFAALAEDIADFRAEFREFKEYTIEELAAIRAEVADIRRELEALKQRVEHMSGYSKEIDHLLERVSVIEDHLRMRPKTAA